MTAPVTLAAGGMRLPGGWRWTRLGDMCTSPRAFDPHSAPEKPFRYVDISSVDNRIKRIVEPKTLLGRDAPSRARQLVREGDIIVATTRPNLNSVALVSADLDGQVCSTGFCVLRPLAAVDSGYLFMFVQSPEFVGSLSDLVRGALYPAVTDSQVRSQPIPLPPLPEQQRIAAILGEQIAAVERARAAAEAQLDAAKALPAAYLRAVFESEEARGWPVKRLGEIGEIAAGVTLGRTLDGLQTRLVPYLRVANVRDGLLDMSDVHDTPATEAEIARCRLRHGDLLLTEGGDPDKLGRGSFWEDQRPECIHQNHIFRVRFDPSHFSPAFLSAQIGSPYGKAYFLAHAKQTTGIATINQKVLSAFPVMAPPPSEQQRVAACLSEQMAAAARLCAAAKAQADALGALPTALLWQAFRGEL